MGREVSVHGRSLSSDGRGERCVGDEVCEIGWAGAAIFDQLPDFASVAPPPRVRIESQRESHESLHVEIRERPTPARR